jgi:tryptophanase
MFGSGDKWPELELVRLAVPRRVYTKSHLDYAAAICTKLHSERESISGLKLIYEAPALRHFTARLEPVE